MNQVRGITALALTVGAILVGAIVLYLIRPQTSKTAVALTPTQLELRSKAYELETRGEWCDSHKYWTNFRSALRDAPRAKEGEPLGALEDEAERNLRLTKSHCEPPPQTDKVHLPDKPDQRRIPPPEPVPEDQLAAIYKPGRTIHSIGILNLSGNGTNDSWLFHGEVHFAYQYRVVIETRVKENLGSRLVFEQQYLDVSEHRAVSKETLQLSTPDSPMLPDVLWDALEKRYLLAIPGYVVAKDTLEVIQALDPNLKETLTFVKGWNPNNDPMQIDYLAKTDDLAGAHLEIEYVSGLGVTDLKVLDGKRFEPELLENLAYNAGVLVDYFVGRAAEKRDGGVEELHSEDIGSMLAMRYDLAATGILKVRRMSAPGRDPAELEIAGGDIQLSGSINGRTQGSHITPTSGSIRYSLPERLVKRANVKWDGDFDWTSPDHLLFNTKNLRNVVAESYYEADLVASQ